MKWKLCTVLKHSMLWKLQLRERYTIIVELLDDTITKEPMAKLIGLHNQMLDDDDEDDDDDDDELVS